MFTSRKKLSKKSGKKGVDRFEFLQELVNEFHQSLSLESQEQVLANLANFAYDPLNYHYLRELKVIELFIDGLQSKNPFFVEYCLKGICNLCNDPLNQETIFQKSGLVNIKEFLKSDNPDFVKLSLTIFIFLHSSAKPSEVATPDIIQTIQKIHQNCNIQAVKNLAIIFLEDVGIIGKV